MTNIFFVQPEFIELDSRKDRENGYIVTSEFMYTRYQAMLPPSLVTGKRILDLGSCVSSAGAWCLFHGASFYQGVEISEEFVQNATFSLKKYYPSKLWDVNQNYFEDFLANNKKPFDVLIASGIIHGSNDPVSLLKSFAKVANFIVIEGMQTRTIFHQNILNKQTIEAIAKDPGIIKFLENESYISVGDRGMIAPDNKMLKYAGLNPSMGAVKYIMNKLGFEFNDSPHKKL